MGPMQVNATLADDPICKHSPKESCLHSEAKIKLRAGESPPLIQTYRLRVADLRPGTLKRHDRDRLMPAIIAYWSEGRLSPNQAWGHRRIG